MSASAVAERMHGNKVCTGVPVGTDIFQAVLQVLPEQQQPEQHVTERARQYRNAVHRRSLGFPPRPICPLIIIILMCLASAVGNDTFVIHPGENESWVSLDFLPGSDSHVSVSAGGAIRPTMSVSAVWEGTWAAEVGIQRYLRTIRISYDEGGMSVYVEAARSECDRDLHSRPSVELQAAVCAALLKVFPPLSRLGQNSTVMGDCSKMKIGEFARIPAGVLSQAGKVDESFNLSSYRRVLSSWQNRSRVLQFGQWPAAGQQFCTGVLLLPQQLLPSSLSLFGTIHDPDLKFAAAAPDTQTGKCAGVLEGLPDLQRCRRGWWGGNGAKAVCRVPSARFSLRWLLTLNSRRADEFQDFDLTAEKKY